jgi:phage tail-like protein
MADEILLTLQIEEQDGSRRTVPLEGKLTIGRQAGNDLALNDQHVSRQHAVIACREDTCRVTDLESSNGTYLNGERVPPNAPLPLEPGATLQIGPFKLQLIARTVAPPPAEATPEPKQDIQAEAEPEPEPQPQPREAAPAVEDDEPKAPPPAATGSMPPPEPPPPPVEKEEAPPDLPPGLGLHSRTLVNYLPGIYQTEFMSRFLALFEAILSPLEWTIDNFDLYLDPGTAPTGFLPWLATWFDLTFDPTWTEVQRREILDDAHRIYARRGTRWALSRVLEIYTGERPTIVDTGPDLDPFNFRVVLPLRMAELDQGLIEQLIDAHKPAHTMYTLEFKS